ncbi:MAG: hypothetical protein HON51_00295 [Gammaproteobacteria bacterium]|jgi:hypothetical protein|nr:hypothetical protein [Gammaproteobacteria bacterium]MBT6419758.1 hypothetical protein [Gammaproteobacteria bacterium]MBT6574683.1 hypothetical protein [Gammaproteobacteria bacterium]MBT7436179.1 hypothetical protein [Gammaproteobacteria bacterium]
MKKRLKCAVLSFCIFVLFGGVNLASADTTPEIEAIFNWAQTNFPQYFSEPQATQMVGEWTFRHYPSSPAGDVYAGVNNGEVFVLGGPWGSDNPTFIDSVVNLTSQIAASGGDGRQSGSCLTQLPDYQAGCIENISEDPILISSMKMGCDASPVSEWVTACPASYGCKVAVAGVMFTTSWFVNGESREDVEKYCEAMNAEFVTM